MMSDFLPRERKYAEQSRGVRLSLSVRSDKSAFTLVETLIAISLITVAIVAPMALTVQSLSVAYYARDQITASNLAQEGIEAVRAVRDGNILSLAHSSSGVNLFTGITPNYNLKIDGSQILPGNIITNCGGTSTATCPPLQINAGGEYGYSGVTTPFTRTVTAVVVWSDTAGAAQEMQVTSVVTWQTASYHSESVTLVEDLYNWPAFGSAG